MIKITWLLSLHQNSIGKFVVGKLAVVEEIAGIRMDCKIGVAFPDEMGQ